MGFIFSCYGWWICLDLIHHVLDLGCLALWLDSFECCSISSLLGFFFACFCKCFIFLVLLSFFYFMEYKWCITLFSFFKKPILFLGHKLLTRCHLKKKKKPSLSMFHWYHIHQLNCRLPGFSHCFSFEALLPIVFKVIYLLYIISTKRKKWVSQVFQLHQKECYVYSW